MEFEKRQEIFPDFEKEEGAKDELVLVPLDSELWEIYRGAYGNVSREVAILMGEPILEPQKKLRRLDMEEKEDYRIAFDNLSENLMHQMSFYEAAWLVMPYAVSLLEQKAADHDFEQQFSLILEMGTWLTMDIPYNHMKGTENNGILENYNKSVRRLQGIVKNFLKLHLEEIRQKDAQEKTVFLTGVLAILGDREAAFVLASSMWDTSYPTAYMYCYECEDCNEDIEFSDSDECEEIIPAPSVLGKWDGTSLEDTYLWFSNLLAMAGADREVKLLSYYYGTYECPECGNKKQVMELMKNYCFGE